MKRNFGRLRKLARETLWIEFGHRAGCPVRGLVPPTRWAPGVVIAPGLEEAEEMLRVLEERMAAN